jgi:hypothetical protein
MPPEERFPPDDPREWLRFARSDCGSCLIVAEATDVERRYTDLRRCVLDGRATFLHVADAHPSAELLG